MRQHIIAIAFTAFSLCSVNTAQAQFPNPPLNVQATDGTSTTNVTVSWEAPTSGPAPTSYLVYRSVSNLFCPGSPIGVVPAATTQYVDTSAQPSVIYYYSVRADASGNQGNCSNTDSGFRGNLPPPLAPTSVTATQNLDDKIQVGWMPPASGQPISGYEIYRSTSPIYCPGSPIATVLFPAVTYDDISAVPNQVYYYTVKSVGPTGTSNCSDDIPQGFRLQPPPPLPPLNVQASDGTFSDKIRVTWELPTTGSPITNIDLFRSTSPALCTTLLRSGLAAGTTSFDDTNNIIPEQQYYYSLRTSGPNGTSICSNVDPGFARIPPICSNGLDDDNDGLPDLDDPGCLGDPNRETEKNPDGPACDNGLDDDGDGKIDYRVDENGDPGCDNVSDPSEDDTTAALNSPAYMKFNTFLGQWNFAEMINEGDDPKQVTLTIFNLFGETMIERTLVVPGNSEVDVDINALLREACDVLNQGCSEFSDLSATEGAENGLDQPDGTVDTYGLVRLEFDDSNVEQRLLGRMSFYRPNDSAASRFSFAFAREFRNPAKGVTYAVANTFDANGLGNLVANWAEVINLSAGPKTYTVNLYGQDGAFVDSQTVTLAPFGEYDVPAGHHIVDLNGNVVQAVYLVEVVPSDLDSEYFLAVSRYSSDVRSGNDPSSYRFAFSVGSQAGSTETQFAPIQNTLKGLQGVGILPVLTNWVEIASVEKGKDVNVTINFRNAAGVVIATDSISLTPLSQFHFNASAILPKDTEGSVDVSADGRVIVQSLSYVHDSNTNQLQTGFVSPGRGPGFSTQLGTINTFLSMQNQMVTFATVGTPVNVTLEIETFGGATFQSGFQLSASGNELLSFGPGGIVNLPDNVYGIAKISTSGSAEALAESRRIRVVSGGLIDFVMPTRVQ